MAIKIIYTTQIEQKEEPVGKILFFDKYQPSNPFFPYFYLGEKNETLNYANWPDLVPYLYDKTLGFFTTISSVYQYKNFFNVYSLSASGNIITLNFVDVDSVKALRAIDEDRKLHFMENGNYNNWNRTLTPTSDINIGNSIYLFKSTNYYIESVNIISDINANITIISGVNNVNTTLLSNKNIEFGLHRIPGKTAFESVLYYGLSGKTISQSDSLDLIGGLRTRSQIMGHAHDHTHTLNNHTHEMPHTHDLSNHTHYMNHRHGYYNVRNGNSYNINPWARNIFGGNPIVSYNNYSSSRQTAYIVNPDMSLKDNTETSSTNSTGAATLSTTSTPSNNITSNILSKTTTVDDINSQIDKKNLKIGDKTFSESYTVYAYIYGKKYLPSI
jgi:hypothetical protein